MRHQPNERLPPATHAVCRGLEGTTATQAFIWQNGVMTYLGSLPGATGAADYARGINNLGQVVGMSGSHAFVWDSVDGMQDLNDLLDASGTGWQLTHPYDINDRGQIVGFGTNPAGLSHAFVLTPIPEPSTLAIWSLLGAVVGFGAWRKRRR